MDETEKRIRLLFVDDEPKFLETVAKRLGRVDFEVVTATDGHSAIKTAKKGKFDVALVDLRMPDLDGAEVLRTLKKRHKFLEVIILTGHGALESAVEATKLGAYGYLPKPCEIDKLLEILREAYEARMRKKFQADEERMKQIGQLATGQSALGILRALRKLDDEEK